jgi:hypothetical protein
MDETSGTTLFDSSGNGNDATISGANLGQPGKLGFGFGFNRQSLIEGPTTLNPGASDFSVSTWVNFTTPPPSDTQDLIRKGYSPSRGGDFKMEVWPAGNIQCLFRGSSGEVALKSKGDISDGTWHFVMCRRQGKTLSVTIDDRIWTKAGPVGAISNSLPLHIGAKNADEDHFLGLMDEVQMTIG